MPRFSVVIPTRDRPQLLTDAINSVLLQDFDDWELVVSDNSTNTDTSKVLDSFRDEGRLRIIRPPVPLNMPDHWEFATKKASSDYVVVLTDRIVLKQHTLRQLATIVRQHPHINCFSYGTQSFLEDLGKLGTRVRNGPTGPWKSAELVNNFLTVNFYSEASLDYCFPKTINSCYRNTFAREVRERYGSYFNLAGIISPDYSSFFVNCSLNDACMFLGEILLLGQGAGVSNAMAALSGRHEEYLSSLGRKDVFERTTIKAPFIYNLMVSDFRVIRDAIGARLEGLETDAPNYYETTYYELLHKKTLGVSEETLNYYEEGWRHAISSDTTVGVDADAIVRAATREYAKGLTDEVRRLGTAARLRAHVRDYLYARFDDKSIVNRICKFRYRNVLEAAGFECTGRTQATDRRI
jgi:glycosyltransferase involved in cell wall biosynthesis